MPRSRCSIRTTISARTTSTALQDVLGARYDAMVRRLSYEATDPTIDSQVVSLQQPAPRSLVTATAPKFAAQAIRKIHDVGWRPLSFVDQRRPSPSAR